MFNVHDIRRNAFMLKGPLAHKGYDWRRHSFTARFITRDASRASIPIRKNEKT